MAALATDQLTRILQSVVQRHNVTLLGVFAADLVPLKRKTLNGTLTDASGQVLSRDVSYCFVLNTDPQDIPGQHWLAFFYNRHTRELEYFDSFGMSIRTHSRVNSALHECNLNVTVANRHGALQSMLST